jgi:hypothetical protein
MSIAYHKRMLKQQAERNSMQAVKITRPTISPPRYDTPNDETIDNSAYNLVLSGAEMRALARLSYSKEGGDEFPDNENDRFWSKVTKIEPRIDPQKLLVKGKRPVPIEPLINPKASLKEVLAGLDEWASQDFEKGKGLWDVLTALRGPDNPKDYFLKVDTTGVIRREAMPKLTRLREAVIAGRNNAIPNDYDDSSHFGRHIRNAARALGLNT